MDFSIPPHLVPVLDGIDRLLAERVIPAEATVLERGFVAAAATAGRALPAPIVVDELAEYPAFELLARCLPQVVAAEPALRGPSRLAAGTRQPW